jgi:hypothetical protein
MGQVFRLEQGKSVEMSEDHGIVDGMEHLRGEHTDRPICVSPIHLIARLERQDRRVIPDSNPIVCVNSVQEIGDDLLERCDHFTVCEPIYCLLCDRVVLYVVPMPYQLCKNC